MMSDPWFSKIEMLIKKLDPDEFDKETKPKKAEMKYVRTKDGIWEIMEIRPNYEKVYYHVRMDYLCRISHVDDCVRYAGREAEEGSR